MEDCVVDGYHIRKGSRIMINHYAIQRDPNVWPEPEKFYERDLRSCPAIPLGITVVRLMLAQLVHCFDLELPNGMQPCDLDVDEHFGIVTSKENHLMVVPKYRLNE
ncbi:hypothetical protein H5410_062635 [Solanum commersonii]|uniref:Cytochrome P450 n=1 Tax=Solanum commersonii TaxID=4109 RepID=A0A9J5WBG2_SOLCO|nr:hypothetical protein H5410_062635 [Solanum commersonii]